MTAQPTLPAVEPKPRRRMRKPLKSVLYRRVDELERENAELREMLPSPHLPEAMPSAPPGTFVVTVEPPCQSWLRRAINWIRRTK